MGQSASAEAHIDLVKIIEVWLKECTAWTLVSTATNRSSPVRALGVIAENVGVAWTGSLKSRYIRYD